MSTGTLDETVEVFSPVRRLPAPSPGAYYVPMEDYLAWDCASASKLDDVRRSPAHARVSIEFPQTVRDQDTVASVVGTAAHMAVLEPELFAASYVKGPAGSWALKANKDAVAALRSQFPGATVLKPNKYDAVLHARDAVLSHPAAAKLLDGSTDREVSITWDDPETGIRCKARPDMLAAQWGAIADLKSAMDASRSGFMRAIANFGYHRKAAFYLDGMNALKTDPYENFAFVAFEKEPPYAVAVYHLDPEVIDAARKQVRTLIHTYADCLESGVWPAYSDQITYIRAPDWALMELEA